MIDITNLLLTGFTKIDDEHKEMAMLFNILYKHIAQESKDEDNISISLSNLISYTRNHFLHEERLMEDISYPHTDKHKREHTRILNEMQLAIMWWRDNKDYKKLNEDMEVKIPNWFMEHIEKIDSPLVKFKNK